MATVAPASGFEDPGVVHTGSWWAALLEVGGLTMLLGSFAYSVVTLDAYEEKFGDLSASVPAVEASDAEKNAQTIADLNSALATANAAADDANSRADQSRQQAEEAIGRAKGLQKEVDDLTSQLKAEQDKAAAAAAAAPAAPVDANAQSRISELNDALNATRTRLGQCTADLQRMRGSYDKLLGAYQKLRNDLQVCHVG